MKKEIARLIGELVATWREDADDPDYEPALRPPASAEQIAGLEAHLGFSLPPSYRAFLELHNGMTNYQNTHLLLGTEDHHGEWVQTQMDFYREVDQVEPFEAGAVPLIVGEADDGINNFWAFDPNDQNEHGELAVVDWDYGCEEDRHPSFLELLRDGVGE